MYNSSCFSSNAADTASFSPTAFALKMGFTEIDAIAASNQLAVEGKRSPTVNEFLQTLLTLSKLRDLNPTETLVAPADTNRRQPDSDVDDARANGDTFTINCLRPIVVDGSNVAMTHGKSAFSCRGVKICVDWFLQRGHQNITVFVPRWRKEHARAESPITDQAILSQLELKGLLVFTPSRKFEGKRIVCYDDRFILDYASVCGGVIVTNDHYRDLVKEKPSWRAIVEKNILMYSFVGDMFMVPSDPLGKYGPTLDEFLGLETCNNVKPCPYGRKCTYGAKCKYLHSEVRKSPALECGQTPMTSSYEDRTFSICSSTVALPSQPLTVVSSTVSTVACRVQPTGRDSEEKSFDSSCVVQDLHNPVEKPSIPSVTVSSPALSKPTSSYSMSLNLTSPPPFHGPPYMPRVTLQHRRSFESAPWSLVPPHPVNSMSHPAPLPASPHQPPQRAQWMDSCRSSSWMPRQPFPVFPQEVLSKGLDASDLPPSMRFGSAAASCGSQPGLIGSIQHAGCHAYSQPPISPAHMFPQNPAVFLTSSMINSVPPPCSPMVQAIPIYWNVPLVGHNHKPVESRYDYQSTEMGPSPYVVVKSMSHVHLKGPHGLDTHEPCPSDILDLAKDLSRRLNP